MRAVIVGVGRTGAYVAKDMVAAGHEVTAIDQDPSALADLGSRSGLGLRRADGCDPEKLEEAGAQNADLVIALTGEDEDNLVVSWLAKYVFGAKKVIARVNNPKNSWLYSEEWGVDAPVSAAKIIGTLIEEEAGFPDLVTLAKLKEGAVSLVEITISGASPADGRTLGEVGIPDGVRLVAVLREDKLLEPADDLILVELDEVLALTSVSAEDALMECFASRAA